MFVQLELFPRGSCIQGNWVVPNTDAIDIPFEWMSVEYLMNMPAGDFHGESLTEKANYVSKQGDEGYEKLRDDLKITGWLDPVYIYRDEEELGNGHHRVVAAFDIGYTHIPVTRNRYYGWRESSDVRFR